MAMGAQMFPFVDEKKVCESTWVTNIEKFPNIQYMYYQEGDHVGMEDPTTLIVESSPEDTFKKTIEAFRYVLDNCDFDWIFRTNLSNYINIPLMNVYVQQLDNDEIVYGAEEYDLNNCPTIDVDNLRYIRGNSLIISRKMVSILVNWYDENIKHYDETIDDIMIGYCLYKYWTSKNKNYLDYIKSYSQAWVNYVIPVRYNQPMVFYTITNGRCKWTNLDFSPEFLSKFINIQTKRYFYGYVQDPRYLIYELGDMENVHKSIGDIDDVDQSVIDEINEYSKKRYIYTSDFMSPMITMKYVQTNFE